MTWVVIATAVAAGAALWTAYHLGALGATRSTRELEQVRHELARRLNELFSLQELSYLLSESLKLDRIVGQVARYVTRFLEAEGALVALVDEDGDRVRVAAAEGTFAPLAGTVLSRASAGPLGLVIGREQMEVLEATATGQHPEIGGIEVQRVAMAPLRAHGVTVGALAVADRTGPFTAEDLRLLSTVATHAAVVLANARFFDLIRAGKEQWETTFDALADGIAVLDDRGQVRRANQALADGFARSLPGIIGVDFSRDLLSGVAELPALLASAARGEAPAGITVQVPGGTTPAQPRILRIVAAPMRGAAAAGWVVVLIEDVTEQKALETQLIQNEKMVAVGQLVSGVAHELNNPLTSIAGLSEFLLEQGGAPERDREHLKVIQEQAERAGRIVRNLLTFARKGAGEYEVVDLNDIARRTALLIEYELRLRRVTLETTLAPTLPTVRGDRYELQQVVLNLVTNAVHAVADNEDRERKVTVTTRSEGDQVLLSVADTGPGVAPEHLQDLFSPFFTTKQPGHGTGLGLSISFGIVERHGGKLHVESSRSGAVFVMALPAGSGADAAPRTDRASGRTRQLATTGPSGAPEPRTILLVDEDPAVQRAIRALFSRDGQTVSTPPTAKDAVNLLEASSFELIVADARAAVSQGEMFAETLLRRWPHLRSRTIFLTADVRQDTHDWLRSTGCHYFQKPFRVSELRSTVRKVMEHEHGAPDTTREHERAP